MECECKIPGLHVEFLEELSSAAWPGRINYGTHSWNRNFAQVIICGTPSYVKLGGTPRVNLKLIKSDINSIEEGVVEGISSLRIGERALRCRCHIIANQVMRMSRK